MNHQIKKLFWYILVLCILFYAVPLSYFMPGLQDTFVTSLSASMLLLYNPAVILAVSAVYGFKHGFKWYLPVLLPVLFIPAVFIFYNSSALVFTLYYEAFCLAGLGLGILPGMRGPKKKNHKSANSGQ